MATNFESSLQMHGTSNNNDMVPFKRMKTAFVHHKTCRRKLFQLVFINANKTLHLEQLKLVFVWS